MKMRQFLLGTAATLVALTGVAQAADSTVLNIYNWSDYIGTDTIANFEKATGIKVSYDTYDANETLDGKLKAGHSGYDLVVPSLVPFLAQQIQAGIYQPLDKSKLPNWSHLDQGLLKRMAAYDKDNAHAIPWVTGTVGIGVVMEKVKALAPRRAGRQPQIHVRPGDPQQIQGLRHHRDRLADRGVRRGAGLFWA